jgi:hypothetical protein
MSLGGSVDVVRIGKVKLMNEKSHAARSVPAGTIDREAFAAMTVRELVEAYPATLSVLAPLGIDLCCGGAHRLGDALDLHGVARDEVLDWIIRAIGAANAPAR